MSDHDESESVIKMRRNMQVQDRVRMHHTKQ